MLNQLRRKLPYPANLTQSARWPCTELPLASDQLLRESDQGNKRYAGVLMELNLRSRRSGIITPTRELVGV